MARPKNPDPKDQRLSLALSRREMGLIQDHALLAGLSVSEYVRRAALGVTIRARPQAITLAALYEVRRIGKNLNQITRMVSDPSRLVIAQRALAVLADLSYWIYHHTPEDRRRAEAQGGSAGKGSG